MLFSTVLVTGAFAALTSASASHRSSHVEAFLANHTIPANHTLNANVTGEHPSAKRGMGEAVLANHCNYDIWAWSVDGMGSSDAIHVPARSRYSEPFREPCPGCGVTYKVSKTQQLEGGKQTQFEYAIHNGQMYYDISFVDCAKGDSASDCPGHAEGLAIASTSSSCQPVDCPAGQYCPEQSYYVDQPLIKLGIKEPVYGCGASDTSMPITFQMCSSEGSLKRSIAGRLEIEDKY